MSGAKPPREDAQPASAPGDVRPRATLRTVAATRYVTPLREGGSLPAIVEADDEGLYVLKFRGAGQGAKALIAELVAGELARALGLPVPEIVFVELDADLARTEPRSGDPAPDPRQRGPQPRARLPARFDHLRSGRRAARRRTLASAIVWFDAFVSNVDRTARNTNLLVWHRKLWLIDHGAALYFHHGWDGHRGARAPIRSRGSATTCCCRSRARCARPMGALRALLTREAIERIVALIPDAWLGGEAIRSAIRRRSAWPMCSTCAGASRRRVHSSRRRSRARL